MHKQQFNRGFSPIAIIIILLIVIGGIAYYYSSHNKGAAGNNTSNSAPEPMPNGQTPVVGGTETVNGQGSHGATNATAPKTVMVNYTDDGFSPASIDINMGDTVTFMNQSSEPMWIASNPHPTHTIYPEFDEKANAGNGQSYSFTFTKVGSWGYHNHRNAGRGGTVVVK